MNTDKFYKRQIADLKRKFRRYFKAQQTVYGFLIHNVEEKDLCFSKSSALECIAGQINNQHLNYIDSIQFNYDRKQKILNVKYC